MRTTTKTRRTSRCLTWHLVPARRAIALVTVTACALLSAGAGASPPNLTGSWQDMSAPAPRSTWHLHAANGVQTLTGNWQGTLTHSGSPSGIHTSLARKSCSAATLRL